MSSSKDEHPPCMGDQQLRDFVRAARKHGYYRESFHSEVERAYRNISPDDIAHGLDQLNWVLESKEFNEDYGQCKYRIRTVDIEGEELHLVIAVDEKYQRFEVISKW